MHDPIHSNLKFDSKIIDVNLLYGAYSKEQRRRLPLPRKLFVLGLGLGLVREKFRINRLRLDLSTLP